jgi:hypothetical protein
MPRGSNFQKPYPPEFRREAVALFRSSGRSLREIAHASVCRRNGGRSYSAEIRKVIYSINAIENCTHASAARSGRAATSPTSRPP